MYIAGGGGLKKCDAVINYSGPYGPYWFSTILTKYANSGYDHEMGIKLHCMSY